MSAMALSRWFDDAPITSSLPLRTNIARPRQLVRFVPEANIRHASQSLESAVICRRGHLAFSDEVVRLHVGECA
jgi:hypothetical protein